MSVSQPRRLAAGSVWAQHGVAGRAVASESLADCGAHSIADRLESQGHTVEKFVKRWGVLLPR
jgi:hypothetical protein